MRPRAIITVVDHLGQPQIAGGETVFEVVAEPEWTGLYDAAGTPLYRAPRRHPIGFDLTPARIA